MVPVHSPSLELGKRIGKPDSLITGHGKSYSCVHLGLLMDLLAHSYSCSTKHEIHIDT